MNFCQYCHTNVNYGYICYACREGVQCPDKNNLCDNCKKFVAKRIAEVEAEARDASSKIPSWLRRAG